MLKYCESMLNPGLQKVHGNYQCRGCSFMGFNLLKAQALGLSATACQIIKTCPHQHLMAMTLQWGGPGVLCLHSAGCHHVFRCVHFITSTAVEQTDAVKGLLCTQLPCCCKAAAECQARTSKTSLYLPLPTLRTTS